MTVFQLVEVAYRHPRRYPRFDVYPVQLLLAGTLEKAEEYLRRYVREQGRLEDVYAFFIREVPLDAPAIGYGCLSERVYGPDGHLTDRRRFSSLGDELGIFEGRAPEEIRFKPGDIVEILGQDCVRLGFVAGVPPSREEAGGINGRALVHLDVTDDSYTVFCSPDYDVHEHIDALRVFTPRFRIPGPTRRKIERAIQKLM